MIVKRARKKTLQSHRESKKSAIRVRQENQNEARGNERREYNTRMIFAEHSEPHFGNIAVMGESRSDPARHVCVNC